MTQAFLILVGIELSNFERFDYIRIFIYRVFFSICCVNGPLDEKKFEIEREIVAKDQDFFRDREIRDKEIKIA